MFCPDQNADRPQRAQTQTRCRLPGVSFIKQNQIGADLVGQGNCFSLTYLKLRQKKLPDARWGGVLYGNPGGHRNILRARSPPALFYDFTPNRLWNYDTLRKSLNQKRELAYRAERDEHRGICNDFQANVSSTARSSSSSSRS